MFPSSGIRSADKKHFQGGDDIGPCSSSHTGPLSDLGSSRGWGCHPSHLSTKINTKHPSQGYARWPCRQYHWDLRPTPVHRGLCEWPGQAGEVTVCGPGRWADDVCVTEVWVSDYLVLSGLLPSRSIEDLVLIDTSTRLMDAVQLWTACSPLLQGVKLTRPIV